MEPARTPVERRLSNRTRCSHLAEIKIGANVTIHAIVKDLSGGGAKIQLPRDAWMPRSFVLSIPDKLLYQQAICRWRRGDFAGLEFVADQP
ncbi:PilZ domain-containing protein [Oricola sp.]|uniref:PilZ domain-containing protein n=1 Tax=Oricola sp. TaxID=1979950 RepID=UPI000C8C30DE|nr:hypothetical protein [Ahrensia sp.]